MVRNRMRVECDGIDGIDDSIEWNRPRHNPRNSASDGKFACARVRVRMRMRMRMRVRMRVRVRVRVCVCAYDCVCSGARWDEEKMQLAESSPKELFVTFPLIWFQPATLRQKPTDGLEQTARLSCRRAFFSLAFTHSL